MKKRGWKEVVWFSLFHNLVVVVVAVCFITNILLFTGILIAKDRFTGTVKIDYRKASSLLSLQPKLKVFRQFLTRFSRSDWFLAMLKISTEHGSKVPVGKLFRKQKTTLNDIKWKVVLVIHHN